MGEPILAVSIHNCFDSGSVCCHIDRETVIGISPQGTLLIFQKLEDQRDLSRVDLGRVSKRDINGIIEILNRLKIHVQS